MCELLPQTRRALLHRVATGQAEGRTPSVSAAVVRGGRLAWSGACGLPGRPEPDRDTQYRIGSVTKTLVAVMVMRLRDEGLLDLADPLRRHLDVGQALAALHPEPGPRPGEPGPRPDLERVGDLTVAQLLSHTSGLVAEARGPWWERTAGELRPDLADILPERPQPHPAGRLFHYSNPGYALLGALVSRLRGEEWHEVLRREVTGPLGMSRTTVQPQPPYERGWAVHPWADVLQPEPAASTGRMAPAGQLWSTAADMGRLAAFLIDGDSRVLPAATLADMRVPASGAPDDDWVSGYGLGLQLLRRDGRLLHGHAGSMPGFVCAVWASQQDGLGAVALTNATAGADPIGIAADLIAIVAEHEPSFPAPWKPLPEVDQDLLALTGLWYWGPRPFLLRLLADRTIDLSPVGGTGRMTRYRAGPDGTWTGLDGYWAGERLRLVRGADGRVGHIDVGTFVFTREPYPPDAPPAARPDPDGWQPG